LQLTNDQMKADYANRAQNVWRFCFFVLLHFLFSLSSSSSLSIYLS
jgi:hypothetical protein